MTEQQEVPRTLNKRDFLRQAKTERDGEQLKVYWASLGGPSYSIIISLSLDWKWVAEILESSDRSNQDSSTHCTLADAFESAVDRVVERINEHWKKAYAWDLVCNQASQEIETFLRERLSRL